MDAAIKAVMVADTGTGGTYTLLTGGIYTRTELGLPGINENTADDAFDDTTGLILPCALIVTGEEVPDNQIVDTGSKERSYQENARIYVYQDGSSEKYDTLLIASGSEPVTPSIEGLEKAEVYGLRNLADCQRLLRQMAGKTNVAVLGGGMVLPVETILQPGRSKCPVMAIRPAMARMVSLADGACSRPLPVSMAAAGVVAYNRATWTICAGSRPVMPAAHSGVNVRTWALSSSNP